MLCYFQADYFSKGVSFIQEKIALKTSLHSFTLTKMIAGLS
jgi:hypothetical protein